MPITSIEQLFAAGGHRTVEGVIQRGGEYLRRAADALRERFGDDYQLGIVDTSAFIRQVIDAIEAGNTLTSRQNLRSAQIPSVSGSNGDYIYTVIGEVDAISPITGNPIKIHIPWTIRSPDLLTPRVLERMALEELREFHGTRYPVDRGVNRKQDDRDREFQAARDSSQRPDDAIAIKFLSVYRE